MRINTFLSDKKLAALGSVVVESAELERTLDVILYDITKMNYVHFKALLGDTMMASKIKLLKQFGLVKLKSKKNRKVFTELMTGLAQANGERSIAVHGSWGPMGNTTLAQLMSGEYFSRPIEATHKESGRLSVERLDALTQKFADGKKSLWKFWKEKWVAPSVRRSLRRKAKAARSGLA